jgi:D-aspartate ligase
MYPAPMTSAPQPPAMLLGGGVIGLSVARCLGPSGIPVHILGDMAEHGAPMRSRWCTEFVHIAPGDGVQDRWLERLRRVEHPGAVVLPCSDDGLELVCRHRAELTSLGYGAIEARDDVALAMLDKLQTYALATAAGIEVPRHFGLSDPAELDARLEESQMPFPCAVKPLHSHLFRLRFPGLKLLVARDRDELAQAVARAGAHGIAVMVTEIIPGSEDAFEAFHGYFDERGEPLVWLTKRKLRQYPVGFGLGTLHVSERNDEVLDAGVRFCRGVGIRGVGNPEFKRDSRDGRLKLIECNHRFSLVNELLRRAQVNTPLLAYRRATGGALPSARSFRRGVRLWYPTNDLRALRQAIAEDQTTPLRAARTLLHPMHLATLDVRDPAPLLESLGPLRHLGARTRAGGPE